MHTTTSTVLFGGREQILGVAA